MRKIFFLLFIMIFIGCKEKVINFNEVSMVDGVAYLKHDMSPVTGKVVQYYDKEHFEMKFEGTFKEGKANGVFRSWYNNGQLKSEGIFRDGKKEGNHKSWYSEGHLKFDEIYENGKLIEKRNPVDFKVIDYYGLEDVMHRNDGKTYVVNFWATWCVPCVKELPHFERLNQAYKDKNVQVVLVSLDFPNQYESKLRPFINKHQLESELYALDDNDSNYWIPQVNKDWSGAIPATLIFNANKRQFYEHPFEYDELEAEVQKFIN